MNESFASMVTTRSVVVLLARAGRWRARPSVRPSSSVVVRRRRASGGIARALVWTERCVPHNTHRRVRTTIDRRRSPTRGWIGRSTNLSSSVVADRGGGLNRLGGGVGDGGQKRKEGIWTVNRRAERERTDAVPTTDGDDGGRRRRRRRRRGVTDPRDGRRRSGFDARRGRR